MQVILLRALRGRLCEALAKVHNGAAQLNLAAHSQAARSLSATAHPCVDGPASDERERLLAAAHQAAQHCALSISEVRPRPMRPHDLPCLQRLQWHGTLICE